MTLCSISALSHTSSNGGASFSLSANAVPEKRCSETVIILYIVKSLNLHWSVSPHSNNLRFLILSAPPRQLQSLLQDLRWTRNLPSHCHIILINIGQVPHPLIDIFFSIRSKISCLLQCYILHTLICVIAFSVSASVLVVCHHNTPRVAWFGLCRMTWWGYSASYVAHLDDDRHLPHLSVQFCSILVLVSFCVVCCLGGIMCRQTCK